MKRTKIHKEFRSAIAKAIQDNPSLGYQQIAQMFDICLWSVCTIAKQFKIKRPRGTASKAYGQSRVVSRG